MTPWLFVPDERRNLSNLLLNLPLTRLINSSLFSASLPLEPVIRWDYEYTLSMSSLFNLSHDVLHFFLSLSFFDNP